MVAESDVFAKTDSLESSLFGSCSVVFLLEKLAISFSKMSAWHHTG